MRYEAYNRVFGTVYLLLATGVLAVLSCAPFFAVVLFTPMSETWPALALTAPLLGPAVAAASTVFGEHAGPSSGAGTAGVARDFVRAWRRHARRAAAVSGAATAAVVVLAVDAVAAFGTPVGAVAIPVLVVLTALVVSSALVLLTALTVRPDVPVSRLWPVCLVLTVRRPWHVLVALAAWGSLAAAIGFAPALAPALLTGPVLYLCWAGATATMRPATAAPAAR
jgi:uncharacterized membrane protein YesL